MAVGSGDILRADVVMLHNSVTTIQNTYQIRNVSAEVDELDALDDIIDVLEALYQLLAGILSVLTVVQRVRVINISDDTDVGVAGFSDPTPGTSASTQAPPQIAYGLNLTTGKLGTRGRKFFGPALEGMLNSDGVLEATPLTALANVGSYMVTPQVSTNSTWEFGVRSTVDGVWRPFLGYGATITAVTQRRRRIGVGI